MKGILLLPKPSLEEIMAKVNFPFKPVAFVLDRNVTICVLTKDVSHSLHWHGYIGIETLTDNHSGSSQIVGFHLWYVDHQLGKVQSCFLPRLLFQAFWRALMNRDKMKCSITECLKIYWSAFGLTIRHPCTWKVREEGTAP